MTLNMRFLKSISLLLNKLGLSKIPHILNNYYSLGKPTAPCNYSPLILKVLTNVRILIKTSHYLLQLSNCDLPFFQHDVFDFDFNFTPLSFLISVYSSVQEPFSGMLLCLSSVFYKRSFGGEIITWFNGPFLL